MFLLSGHFISKIILIGLFAHETVRRSNLLEKKMSLTSQKIEKRSIKDHSSNDALDLVAFLSAGLGKAKVLPLRPQDEALLKGVDSFCFGPDGSRKAWSIGEGPLVVLVHGYSGRGVQMATLARHLASKGFQCLFFDAGGHGESQPEKIGFSTFIRDTRDFFIHIKTPVYALIGHSAGALAMMRARELYGISAEKYAIISAPLFPYVPLESMRATGAPEESIGYMKAVLSDQFEMSWSSLVGGEAFVVETDKALLAIYDTEDPMVRHTDAEVLAGIWPKATVVKTSGYGHNRILQAEETLAAVAGFVNL
ncbi:MAG: pimeloyl-ACP methyl ester carboxylesterase [Parvibaculaceae bacterium]